MDIRDQILNATTRLMASRGFSGTSVQAIADEVGIRKASVLYHFPNKDALRQGALNQILSHWGEVLPRLMMATSKAGVERFDAVMAEIMAFFAADPDRARLLLREILDRPDAMRLYLVEFVKPWMEVVASYIEKGQRAGEIHQEVDAAAYVLQIAQMCLSATATAQSFRVLLDSDDNPASGRERYLEEMVRVARKSLFT